MKKTIYINPHSIVNENNVWAAVVKIRRINSETKWMYVTKEQLTQIIVALEFLPEERDADDVTSAVATYAKTQPSEVIPTVAAKPVPSKLKRKGD